MNSGWASVSPRASGFGRRGAVPASRSARVSPASTSVVVVLPSRLAAAHPRSGRRWRAAATPRRPRPDRQPQDRRVAGPKRSPGHPAESARAARHPRPADGVPATSRGRRGRTPHAPPTRDHLDPRVAPRCLAHGTKIPPTDRIGGLRGSPAPALRLRQRRLRPSARLASASFATRTLARRAATACAVPLGMLGARSSLSLRFRDGG